MQKSMTMTEIEAEILVEFDPGHKTKEIPNLHEITIKINRDDLFLKPFEDNDIIWQKILGRHENGKIMLKIFLAETSDLTGDG